MLEILRGVAEEIERSGYSLILYTTAGGADSERAFMSQVVPAGAVEGLALVIPPGMLDYIGRLAKRGLPVVVIDDRGHHPEFPTVATTNVEGGRSATQHLIGLGRRRIGMVNGPLEYGCNRDRLDGHRSTPHKTPTPFNPSLLSNAPFP